MKPGFIYHTDFLKHATGEGHPERVERLSAIVSRLAGSSLVEHIPQDSWNPCSENDVLLVHTPRHLDLVKQTRHSEAAMLDPDTRTSRDSFDVALLAAGAAIEAVRLVTHTPMRRVFCAVRPPGHHAERDKPMGFCLFNNAAIAARVAQEQFGLNRIAIVDWDVHHGNGTQDIFYEDPTVLYISIHQYPLYPGSGARSETGSGAGKGYTLNIPMRSGSGESQYLDAFRQYILPRIDTFTPHLIILSAGFDAHADDPLANINLTEHSFALLTRMLRASADANCDGRMVSILEGGYNLRALSLSVEQHLRELG